MNGVVFWRLIQSLDEEQPHPNRKVILVVEDFPTLAGNTPCPGIEEMLPRLRMGGVTALMTDRGLTSVRSVYGERARLVGQCGNVIYLRQPDTDSAAMASDDLGDERGEESERLSITPSELMGLPLAAQEGGIEGRAKSPAVEKPWAFRVALEFLAERIPQAAPEVPESLEWKSEAQRLRPLTAEERSILIGDEPTPR